MLKYFEYNYLAAKVSFIIIIFFYNLILRKDIDLFPAINIEKLCN